MNHSTIEDRLAIQDLLYRYADAADRRDGDAFCACFANGGTWIVGPGYEMRDGHLIASMLAERYEWTMHNVHNHAFTIDGDRAHGYTYCVAAHVKREGGQRIKEDMYIRYRDELARQGNGWVFVKRELEVGLFDVRVLDGAAGS